VGEECTECIIAAKGGDRELLTLEVCDLLYHLLILCAEEEVPLSEVEAELARRREKSGNLKAPREVDRDT